MYTVLARKWRPQVFEDLVGQQTVTQTLKNAIVSGRIAHAFLFSGPRGIGKTTCARILAKALNCHSSSGPTTTPCNVCPSCVDISASRSLDVLEIDGASNRGIDEVRELRESAKYNAMRDRFRIYIIDEVHMLTVEAFNALLKILEEPPPHVYFIFATTEFRKVPATIVSRCQLFDFKKIPDRLLVDRLRQITKEEGIEISDGSLAMIATASEGGLRDALGSLDQIIAFSGTKVQEKDVETVLGLVDTSVMMSLGEAIAEGNSAAVISILDQIAEYGIDYKIFYNELLSFYRNLFLLRFSDSVEIPSSSTESMRKLALQYEEVQLLRICHQLVSIQNLLRLSGNLRFLFEITLVKLSQIKRLIPIEEIAESLKKNVSLTTTPAKISSVERSDYKVRAGGDAVGTKAGDISDDFFARLISELESQKPRLAAALENAQFQRNDSKISFYVPENYLRMMKLEEEQAGLQAILQEKLGMRIRVEIVKGAPPTEAPSTKVATPEKLVQEDPTVQEFVKAFKGKIGKIELSKDSRM
jgi:DNA polymerase-3 subunit gamma/tau